MALCAVVPSYRNARALSFLAALGTTFTAWFVVAASVAALNDPTRPPPPNGSHAHARTPIHVPRTRPAHTPTVILR